MKADDFLNTAQSLRNSLDEWDVRTSISRSYYAVYLHVRDFITVNYSHGKDFPTDKHNSVGRCFGRCTEKTWKKLSVAFNTLHQYRTDADYKLEKPFTRKNSNLAFTQAKTLLADYKAYLSDTNLAGEFQKAVGQEFEFNHRIKI